MTVQARKLALLVATAIISVNFWTGFPLFSVWVGSRVQGSFGSPSMTAVFVVIVIFALLVFLGATVLATLNERYDKLIGRPPPPRQAYPWNRAMSGERAADLRRSRGTSPMERVVVAIVVAAVLAFEVWFFFFAGSSLPNT